MFIYLIKRNFFVLFCCIRLAEVGKLEVPKLQGQYDTGQLFLHRVFGYRGVILFPWLARVYDRDLPNQTKNIAKIEEPKNNTNDSNDTNNSTNTVNTAQSNENAEKEAKGKTNTFYQVLIDSRDCPYIVNVFISSKNVFQFI